MNKFWPWLCALLSGILLALCYAPANLGGVAWFALTPLLHAVWFAPRSAKRESERLFLLGYVAGLGYFLGSLHWLVTVTVPGWIALCLYLAVYPASWALFVGTVARPKESEKHPAWLTSFGNLKAALLAATAWAGLEWIRGTLFTGFGWNSLGVALNKNIALIQICDITGVAGPSFLLVMVNGIIVTTVQRLRLEFGRHKLRPHYDFSLTVALVALVFAYGVRQMMAPPRESKPLSFAAIQTDVPIVEKRDPAKEKEILDLHTRLTEQAIAMKPDLIIWPEAATPQPLFRDKASLDTVYALTKKFDGDLLLGTVHFAPQGAFNSMALLTHHAKEVQIYHKIHLVPFGEYVPLRKSFPLFAWIVGDLVPDDFDPGPRPILLNLKATSFRFAPLICFEDTLGDLARQFALQLPSLFITVTNDGWFLESAGSAQHLQNAIFRCVEAKLPMIRAANTGVTCAIDSFGRVVSKLENEKGSTFLQGFLNSQIQVPLKPDPTFYTENGDLFAQICLGVAAVFAALHIIARFRAQSACRRPADKKSSNQ